MDQLLPTRSQVEGVEPFFSTYAGEAFRDTETLYFPDADKPATFRHAVPAKVIHAYMERWLRENWAEMVDYAVGSEVLAEDPEKVELLACSRVTGPVFQAHGPHGKCPGLKAHPATAIGRLPSTTMVSVDADELVPTEVAVILTGVEKSGKSPHPVSPVILEGLKGASLVAFEAERPGKLDDRFGDEPLNATEPPKQSDHRNTDVLRDMGYDL